VTKAGEQIRPEHGKQKAVKSVLCSGTPPDVRPSATGIRPSAVRIGRGAGDLIEAYPHELWDISRELAFLEKLVDPVSSVRHEAKDDLGHSGVVVVSHRLCELWMGLDGVRVVLVKVKLVRHRRAVHHHRRPGTSDGRGSVEGDVTEVEIDSEAVPDLQRAVEVQRSFCGCRAEEGRHPLVVHP